MQIAKRQEAVLKRYGFSATVPDTGAAFTEVSSAPAAGRSTARPRLKTAREHLNKALPSMISSLKSTGRELMPSPLPPRCASFLKASGLILAYGNEDIGLI